MELIIKHINGKFTNYTEIYAPVGYCFCDKDEQDRSYMERVTTPITDEQVLREKYVLVEGSAEKLNEEVSNTDTD